VTTKTIRNEKHDNIKFGTKQQQQPQQQHDKPVMTLKYAASSCDISSIKEKMNMPMAMVKLVKTGRPPGMRAFQAPPNSIMGPQNIPKPPKANTTIKAFPMAVKLSPGQMSP
jgi:hypothetical protein